MAAIASALLLGRLVRSTVGSSSKTRARIALLADAEEEKGDEIQLGILLLLVACISPPKAAAQAEVYGNFSVTDLTETTATGNTTDILYGATTGLILDGPKWHHVVVSADIQGRYVRKSGESLNGMGAGPRFSYPLKKFGLTPYAEFLVGFARYNSTNVANQIGPTTDSQIQVNGGVAKKLTPRWDVAADFSYSQYYAFGGAYNPKSFGVGAIYHFVRR